MTCKFISPIILIIVLISCSESIDEYNGEMIQIGLNAEPLEGKNYLDEDSILGLIYLTKIDSLLIASTTNQDQLYYVLDYEKIKGSFGSVGRGPKQISYPYYIYDGNKNYVYIYDSQLLLLNRVDIQKSITTNKIEIIDQVELPKELIGIKRVYYIDNNLLMGMYDDNFSKRLNQKRGVFFYDQGQKTYDLLELTNIDITPYEAISATNINAKMPTLSPDRKKLAIASVHNPLLEIVDIENKKVREFKLEGKEVLENYRLEDFKDGEAPQYFTFAYSTNQNIYLLYKGYSENDSKQNPDFIKIYTWDGDLVSNYEIPFGYELSSFFVNEEKGKLIGHSLENGKAYNFELK